MRLHIVQVVQQVCHWVFNIDADDLPVGLAAVNHGDNAQGLHANNGTSGPLALANINDVKRVIVANAVLAIHSLVGRVFPGLGESAVVPHLVACNERAANSSFGVLHGIL